jgi:hypothetical protein
MRWGSEFLAAEDLVLVGFKIFPLIVGYLHRLLKF